jgi:multiple sugar transport system substrate-binding protein
MVIASSAWTASADSTAAPGDAAQSSSSKEIALPAGEAASAASGPATSAISGTTTRPESHAAGARKVQLRVVPPPASSSAGFQRAQRAVFDEYVRTHPDVELVPAGGLQLEGGTGGDLLAIAGGVSPDVFSLYFKSMHSYIEQGFVLPLDGYLDTWEGLKDVPAQLWPVATGRDGKRYGAIYNWPTSYLIYRRDLFREAGLDPKRPPQNWDELYYDARRLSRPDMRVSTAVHKNLPIGRYGLFLPFNGTYTF